MKYRENRRRPVNPFEAERNIYQHARQSIEGNQHGLAAQLAADFGPYNFDVANGKSAEGVVVLNRGNHRRVYAIDFRKVVKVGDDAVSLAIAIVENFFAELGVLVPGVRGSSSGSR